MAKFLVWVLQIADSDDRFSMWYLYEIIHCTKNEMMRRSQRRKTRVQLFIDIINKQWDTQLNRYF
jgi:hypothetical protein